MPYQSGVNASSLLGTALPSAIVTSSLTSVGTLTTLTVSGAVAFTSNGAAAVNIGVAGSGGGNTVNINRTGVGGAPVASGTTQTYGLLRLQSDGFGTVLDAGSNGGTGFWLQSTLKTDLSSNQPLLLNPLGGDVVVGASLAIGNTVGAAVAVASTHKVTISIGGATYYLLATNV